MLVGFLGGSTGRQHPDLAGRLLSYFIKVVVVKMRCQQTLLPAGDEATFELSLY
jgi:hypothetical protein